MSKFRNLIYYGISRFFNLLPDNISGIPVLLYHRVGTEEDCKLSPVACISIDNFELQLDYLVKQGYYFATLDEVVKYVKAEITLPKKTTVITFDDGFQDNHRYAFPALKERGINATIFINAGFIGGKLSADEAGVTPPYRKDAFCWFLSWDEIIEMSNNGIDFEPHTHTHVHLTAIAESEMEREIKLSKDIIEERLNKTVKHFCYPYGEYNEKVCDVVRKMGFESAWAVRPYNVKPKMDLYTLPRKGSGNVSLERFKITISDYEKCLFFAKGLCGRK
jgi:peptidoglycan/xylan/chitin deacetylase (PgdA/CDA1 family)